MKTAVITAALAGVLSACGEGGVTSPQASLTATIDGQATTQTHVGGHASMTFTVTNTGGSLDHFGIVFLGGDVWYDHHVITSSGSCQIDKEHKAFDCGPLKAGATMNIDIEAVAKDAGNYHYDVGFEELSGNFDFVNTHPGGTSDTKTWDEAILPE